MKKLLTSTLLFVLIALQHARADANILPPSEGVANSPVGCPIDYTNLFQGFQVMIDGKEFHHFSNAQPERARWVHALPDLLVPAKNRDGYFKLTHFPVTGSDPKLLIDFVLTTQVSEALISRINNLFKSPLITYPNAFSGNFIVNQTAMNGITVSRVASPTHASSSPRSDACSPLNSPQLPPNQRILTQTGSRESIRLVLDKALLNQVVCSNRIHTALARALKSHPDVSEVLDSALTIITGKLELNYDTYRVSSADGKFYYGVKAHDLDTTMNIPDRDGVSFEDRFKQMIYAYKWTCELIPSIPLELQLRLPGSRKLEALAESLGLNARNLATQY